MVADVAERDHVLGDDPRVDVSYLLAAAQEQAVHPQRADLPRQRLFQELGWINGAIAPNSNRFVTRLFTRPEDELTAEKLQGEARIGEELADLNLYHYILITDAKPDETERLIDQLNALAVVEIAYPQPITAVGQVDAAPSTPNFTTNQGYLGPASTNGIDVAYARSFPGTRGNDVQMRICLPSFFRLGQTGVISTSGSMGRRC